MAHKIDMVGRKINRLTVISHVGSDSHRCATWSCLCDCGKTTIVSSRHLKSNGVQSCGCVRNEAKSTHGDRKSGDGRAKEYKSWTSMKQRCTNPKNIGYKNYGGRGITVCERWFNSYVNFITDMGRAPSQKHSIERNDNDGNYEPNNCRWATALEQVRNRRNTLKQSA